MIDKFLDCVASRMLPSAGLIGPVKVLFFNWQRQFCTAHSPASCCILPPASVSLTQPLSPLQPAGPCCNTQLSSICSSLRLHCLPTPYPSDLLTHSHSLLSSTYEGPCALLYPPATFHPAQRVQRLSFQLSARSVTNLSTTNLTTIRTPTFRRTKKPAVVTNA